MTVSLVYEPRQRQRGWRASDAWCEEEARPCGARDALRWRYWTGGHRSSKTAPDLSDCLAITPKLWRLIVWEPLVTKAPGPHLTEPLCCYIQTIIFYTWPYTVNRFNRWWRSDSGWRESETGSFFEWDKIESRIGWDDKLVFRGETFEYGVGRVLWTSLPGARRRWWMRHGLRREKRAQP